MLNRGVVDESMLNELVKQDLQVSCQSNVSLPWKVIPYGPKRKMTSDMSLLDSPLELFLNQELEDEINSQVSPELVDEFLKYLPSSFEKSDFLDPSDFLDKVLSDNDSIPSNVEITTVQDCEPLAGLSHQEERSTPSSLPAEKQSPVFCVGDSSTPAIIRPKTEEKGILIWKGGGGL